MSLEISALVSEFNKGIDVSTAHLECTSKIRARNLRFINLDSFETNDPELNKEYKRQMKEFGNFPKFPYSWAAKAGVIVGILLHPWKLYKDIKYFS